MARSYGLKFRPAEPCTMPKGAHVVSHEDHKKFRFGVVQFDREITDQEVYNFELTPVITIKEHAKVLVGKMGRYSKRYNALNMIGFIQSNYGSVYSTDNISELVAAVTNEIDKIND